MPSQPSPRPRLDLDTVPADKSQDKGADWRKYKTEDTPDPAEDLPPVEDEPDEDDSDEEPEPIKESAVNLEWGKGGEMDLRLFYAKLRDAGFPELEDASEGVFDSAQDLAVALGATFSHHQEVWQAEDTGLRERAALGDEWLENTRQEIRRVYRLAKASDPTSDKAIRLVDMSRVDDLIKNIGPNALALRGLLEDWTQAAEHRLPKSVRRSSLPDVEFLEGRRSGALALERHSDPAVKKIHG